MTEQELKKLGRGDLLQLLLEVSEENVRLREALEDANSRLESRRIDIEEAGSLSEAVMKLNGVFEAAEAACAQYTENIRAVAGRQSKQLAALEEETRARCAEMLAQAEREAAMIRRRASMQAPDRPTDAPISTSQVKEANDETPTVRTPYRRAARRGN